MKRCRRVMWVLGLAACLSALPAWAQTPGYHRGGGMAGAGVYRPGEWAVVTQGIDNPDTEARTLTVVVAPDFAPERQFAREVEAPARSRLRVITPIHLGTLPSGLEMINLDNLLVTTAGGVERSLAAASTRASTLRIEERRPVSAVISDTQGDDTPDLFRAASNDTGRTYLRAILRHETTPPLPMFWDVIDSLLIVNGTDRVSEAHLEALRHWLITGGRLWIRLDLCDPDFARRLLGDELTLDVIDDVALNTIDMISTPPPSGPGARPPARQDDARPEARPVVYRETPVQLRRVLTRDMAVLATVDGWPVVMEKTVGRGRVMITTLGVQGLIGADGAPRPAVSEAMGRWFEPRATPPVDFRRLQPIVAEQIGYEIIGRGTMIVVLGGFCLVLLASAVWFGARDQSSRITAIGVVAAVAATVALAGMGAIQHGRVPETLASLSMLEVEGALASTSGVAGLYSPGGESGSPDPVLRGQGVIMAPEAGRNASQRVRLVWSGLDAWRWESFDLAAGAVTPIAFRSQTRLAEPVQARAWFDADGVRINLDAGELGTLEDVILAGHDGALGVTGRGENLRADTALSGGQYVTTASLTDQQRRRTAVYRALFDGTAMADVRPGLGVTHFPPQPTLMGWINAPDLTNLVRVDPLLRGDRLVVVTPRFERAAPGSRVRVASPLIRMDRGRFPWTGQLTTIYDGNARSFVGRVNTPATITMAFFLPEAVLPLTSMQATLSVHIDGPGRQITLFDPRADRPTPLEVIQNPTGVVQFAIRSEDGFHPDADGVVLVPLRVDESPTAGQATPWEIFQMGLDVTGVVADATTDGT